MTMVGALNEFNSDVFQCDGLIATAHHRDVAGALTFSLLDRRQIVEAAFLNMFIAWESFLEKAMSLLMTKKNDHWRKKAQAVRGA